MKAVLCACLLSVVMCGCATPPQSRVNVTYYSDPEYATLYSLDGGQKGVCPVTLSYSVDEEDRARGHCFAQGLKARWVSGAEREYSRFKLEVNGTDRAVTFTRPPGAPHPEIDAAFALQKEANAIAQRQAAASASQSSSGSGDPFMQFMTDLNHALTPVAVEKELQRGNYQRARELNANDQMLQRLNRMSNP